VYRLRTLGLALGFPCVATVLHQHGAPPVVWAALLLNAGLWPHAAWQLVRRSADPHASERINLLVDSALGGMWIALMQFNLLPSVLLVVMLTMDKIGWGGPFMRVCLAAMAGGCAVTAAVTGAAVDVTSNMPVVVASLPLMIAYPISVAFVVNRSGELARERRRAVEQTAELREELAHVARVATLGEMAAGLAHELNQPLTAIHLEASAGIALGDRGDVEGMRESLNQLSNHALRAGEIVRRMRQFARRGETNPEPVALGPVVTEVLALVEHDIRHNEIQTAVEMRDDLPPAMIDRIALQQVLVNLIRNAIEAMSRPSVLERHLTIRAESVGGRLRVSIADTGGGVDPAMSERLFHPFQTTKSTGLGLGLSICQSLIEAHGGRMGAGPHPPGGALFYFELPIAEGAS
jgi:signal transduction histidine kinase